MHKEFNKVKPYVYWIKNLETGIKYIGVRWRNVKLNKTPIQDLGKKYFSSGLLEKDFKKNSENFRIKFISTFNTVQEAVAFENKRTKKIYKNKRYANIAAYPAIINTPEGLRKIALGNIGKKHSEESKRKIGLAHKGKKHLEKTKKKITEAVSGKNNPNYGKKLSEERKKQIGLSSKGRTFSLEFKRKISKAKKGIKFSEEHKRKISKALTGIKRSEETKRKISESAKAR